MYINMRKLNRFYNTLIFITQRLKSVSRAEHELLDVEFEREGATETIKPFNYNFFSFCCDGAENFVLAPRSLPINILLLLIVVRISYTPRICVRCGIFPLIV